MKKNLNQKLINLVEYYNLINANLLLSDIPLKRSVDNITSVFDGTVENVFITRAILKSFSSITS